MSNETIPGRFKVPAGSLVVDTALVVALIWSQAGTVKTLESFDLRLHAAEIAINNHGQYEARLSVTETQIGELSDDQSEMKSDIVKRLDRIESKLDKIR
jgi:hypothetical protein